ncbi:MAG: hypothetical protein ACK5YW_05420 [Betaproteobacteria bacterium]|jgi:hypothetical protein|nr:hypothetical protein [Rhodocyclaceae bacterium]MCA3143366.1 hypothetical protein [Rhodocyclaceae bacterium]MCA3147249.1 hypothetical protein [Rhodocyclaceae bacterium]MCE2897012.1 hypothetical protein [Betaproteobacteria bacterium]
MAIARGIFVVSLLATQFWVFGFALERIAGTEPPLVSYAFAALVVTSLIVAALFRAFPSFLAVAPGTAGRFFRSVVAWTVASYLAGALVVGLSAYWLLAPGSAPDVHRGEAALAAYILAFWLPLWFSPAAGLSLAWWQAPDNMRSNLAVKRDAPQAARPLP